MTAHFVPAGEPVEAGPLGVLAPWPGPGVVIFGNAPHVQACIVIPWNMLDEFVGNILDLNAMYQERIRDATPPAE